MYEHITMRPPAPRTIAARAISVALFASLVSCSNDASTADPAASRQISTGTVDSTSQPPWPAPAHVNDRVADAGLDLGPMGMAEHYHPELEIVVDGRKVPVAPNIGVDLSSGAMSALHTHAADGVIHVEADQAGERFTLGQFFTEWGVQLSRQQIGGVRATSNIVVTVNGERYEGDPAEVRLEPDQKIEVEIR
ncbi:MAG: hypothetical protein WKF54_08110 [Nocardioidaceae bacterium]